MSLLVNSHKTFPNFKAVFCWHFNCPEASFAEELLWKSLDPYWRGAVSALRRVNRGFLRKDLEYLEHVGAVTSWRDLASLANGIRREPGLNRGFLRGTFHLRISGERLLRLREEILYPERGVRP